MSEFVKIATTEFEQAQAVLAEMNSEETKALFAELRAIKAQAEENRRTGNRPPWLSGKASDVAEQREKAEHVAEFLRNAFNGNDNAIDQMQKGTPEFYTQKANFNTGTDAEGGYLVPIQWENAIAIAAEKYGYAPRIARSFPMTQRTHYLFTGSELTGYEVAEGASPTTNNAANHFARVSLTAKRFAAGYIVTRDELRDAIPEFVNYLAERLGQALAKRIDQTFFKGQVSASNHFDGVLYASGVTIRNMAATKTAYTQVSWTNLRDLEGDVPSSALDNAIFVVPRSAYIALGKELDSNNRPIWTNERPIDYARQVGLEALGRSVVPGPGGGYPMVVIPDTLVPTAAADTPFIAFGDFSESAYFGIREGMTMELYSERWNGVDLAGHSRAVEVQASYGIAFNDPAAFAILETAAS